MKLPAVPPETRDSPAGRHVTMTDSVVTPTAGGRPWQADSVTGTLRTPPTPSLPGRSRAPRRLSEAAVDAKSRSFRVTSPSQPEPQADSEPGLPRPGPGRSLARAGSQPSWSRGGNTKSRPICRPRYVTPPPIRDYNNALPKEFVLYEQQSSPCCKSSWHQETLGVKKTRTT